MASQAERSGLSSATPLLALVVATAVLYLARELIIPLALAVLFAFMLAPLVRRFESWRFGRVPSTLLAVLLGMAVILGLGWLAANQALGLAGKLPEYRENISRKLKDLREAPKGNLGKAAEAIKELESEASGAPKGAPGAAAKPEPEKPRAVLPSTPLEAIAAYGVPAAALLAIIAAIVVISTLVLLNRYDLRDRVVRLVGEGWIHITTQTMEEAAGRVSRYLLSLLLVNVCYGTVLAIAFAVLGIPNALLWGLLSAVMRFVPYVGAPAAAILPLALAFAISDGWALVAWTLAAIVVADVLIAYVVEPWLYGVRTGLSPIAVVLAAVFWTWLWGPFGLILSTPLTVCIVVVARNIPSMEFLAVILSDEPVLPPPVRFYQRLVSFEYDEAEDLAETCLREEGLESLYGCMLLPALVLAKRDKVRGALEPARERFVFEGMTRVAEEAADGAPRAAATEAAPVRPGTNRIAIVPAHEEADRVAAQMLARLLSQERLECEVMPADILAAEVLERVEASGASAVCVSAVPPAAASNAAYLVKRLRRRFPQARLVVALWCADANVAAMKGRLQAAGADEVVTRLPEALERMRLVGALKASLP